MAAGMKLKIKTKQRLLLTALCFLSSLYETVATSGDEPNKAWGFGSGRVPCFVLWNKKPNTKKRTTSAGVGADSDADEEETTLKVVDLIEASPCQPDHTKAVDFVQTYGDLNSGNTACDAEANPNSCGGGCCRFGAFSICDDANKMAHLQRTTTTMSPLSQSLGERTTLQPKLSRLIMRRNSNHIALLLGVRSDVQ